jgi:hypothetical protein
MPTVAHAEISPQDAQGLEQQIRSWLSGVLGPHVALGERPVQMIPESDHYRLEIPLSDAHVGNGYSIGEGAITGSARPLDNQRWAIEGLRMSSPLRAERPTKNGSGPRSLVIQTASQNLRGVIDPSLATVTSLDATLLGYVARSDMEDTTQTTRVERAMTHTLCEPAEHGRVNVLSTSTSDKLSITEKLRNSTELNVSADRLMSTGHFSGVSPAQIGVLIRSALDLTTPVAALGGDVLRGALPIRIPTRSRPAARALVLALDDMLGAAQQDSVVEGIHVDTMGRSADVRRLDVSAGFDAPDGRMDAHASVVADGVQLATVLRDPYRDFLPHHIVLQPHVSGIALHALTNLALHVIDSDENDARDWSSEMAVLFAKGPLHIGLDQLALDLGPAALQAKGGIDIASVDSMSGQAHIVATGFDALIGKVNATADLRRLAPMLFLLKGLGRQDGENMVWDVSYENGKLMVNDTDFSTLAPTRK